IFPWRASAFASERVAAPSTESIRSSLIRFVIGCSRPAPTRRIFILQDPVLPLGKADGIAVDADEAIAFGRHVRRGLLQAVFRQGQRFAPQIAERLRRVSAQVDAAHKLAE